MRWIYLIRVILMRLNPHGCSWFGAPSSVLLRGAWRTRPEPGETRQQPEASSIPTWKTSGATGPDVLGWALDSDAGDLRAWLNNWQTPTADGRESHSRSTVCNPILRFSNTGKYFTRVLCVACARTCSLLYLLLLCCYAVHMRSTLTLFIITLLRFAKTHSKWPNGRDHISWKLF